MEMRFAVAAAVIFIPMLPGAEIFLHGRVVMADGSPPPRLVTIERICTDNLESIRETATNPKGEFIWHVTVDAVTKMASNRVCSLRASNKGFDSSLIDVTDWKWFSEPVLPDLVLTKHDPDAPVNPFSAARPPAGMARAWERAGKAAQSKNWAEAERQLRIAVDKNPRYAPAWHALGIVYQNEQKVDEARDAHRRSIELNSKMPGAFLSLARLDLEAKDWAEALKTADGLIEIDPRHKYFEAYLDRAIAQYQLKDLSGAAASATEAVRLDKKHEIPRTEYVLGLVLAATNDPAGAREHLQRYLELEPKASDRAAVESRMEHLGSPEAAEIGADLENVAARLQLGATGEAWVPGGIAALAGAAHLEQTSTYQDFFANYCRQLVRENSPGLAHGYPSYYAWIETYMAVVAELGRLGQRRDDKTTITLSLVRDAQRTEHILNLFGWKLAGGSVEPGDQPGDGGRQRIPGLLGIDEIAMQEALEAGRNFVFEVPSDTARLVGGDAWSQLIRDLPAYPGGVAEAFARDPRLAKTYAGLSAMGPDTAAAVVAGTGLNALVEKYSDTLARYAETFRLSADSGAAATPGEEDVWKKLAGVSPRNAPAFFRALLDRDQGSLAAFYMAMSRADAAHRRFFTADPARAERFYAWYRDSGEPRWSMLVPGERWRAALFERLPLDSAGAIRFPGGKRAWTSSDGPDEDVLLKLPALEAFAAVTRLVERRGAPLDEASASLLARNFPQWHPLFPYFERLPGLGQAEFTALAAFTGTVAGATRQRQNAMLGQWFALVELIDRGMKAGSLDAAGSARAFERACELVAAGKATDVLREMSGGTGDPRELVARNLLRLDPERRASFDRVLTLQNMAAEPTLAGLVYAAAFEPQGLLINEDPLLVTKHQFVRDESGSIFQDARLISSNTPPGSYFSGGFLNLDQQVRKLASGSQPEPAPEQSTGGGETASGPAPVETEITPPEAIFRADARLVEVFATVTDSRGRYVDDLTRAQFTIVEQGKPQDAAAFESRSSEVSVALLLDTTGSMQGALPALKNAALKLIGELRAEDRVSVYTFAESVSEAQPFTTDKAAAKRAVLRAQPFGETALYDALARVNRDLSGRSGKKVIVVFTDGNDNASTLTAQTAIRRAKASGVPVYTIAQGEALRNPEFLKQLSNVSQSTGGAAYVIHGASEIREVFEGISQDLQHGYFFAFRPSPGDDRAWRAIEVQVRGSKGYKIRAREGYYPQ
jgi:Ca-activated chloride channel family protein